MKPDIGLLILRVGTAALFMTHGWPKLQKLLAGDYAFPDPIGIGPLPSLVLVTAAEVLFALLVALGAWTRWSAIPPAFDMAVAVLTVHAADPLPKKELAIFYLVVFTALVFTGGGRYSVDEWIRRRRSAPVPTGVVREGPAPTN